MKRLKKHLLKWVIALAVLLPALVLFSALSVARSSVGDNGRMRDEPFCVMLLGRDVVSGNADVVALLRVSGTERTISVLQIPRDTYICENGFEGKLNGYCDAFGEDALQKALERALGVSVSGYFSLDTHAVEAAVDAIGKADMLIVGGTSLTVYPAAGLIDYYKGDRLVLINRDPTPYDSRADLVIHDSLGNVFSQI